MAFSFLFLAAARADQDSWDQPPLNYSSTEPSNAITRFGSPGVPELPTGKPPLEQLRILLDRLHIPLESQVLVFSKTSFQNSLIHPKNPRCLYFSENAYVGYVPGGAMEVIIQDPALGPVFYRIDPEWQIARDRTDCLSCHATARTENMPGMLIRSTFPRSDGQPLMSLGSQTVTDATPLAKRWGGYYVTGTSSLPHLGNQTFTAKTTPAPSPAVLTDLRTTLDTSRYLLPTSDIVALLVLEHQCQMHNLLHSASAQYRRTAFLGSLAAPESDPDQGAAGRLADQMAVRIVDGLFFKDEAPLDGEVQGGGAFEEAFTRHYPHTADGRSLAEFQLNTRIFKHRCSYMVYSDAFTALAPRVKTAVLSRMKAALTADVITDDYAFMKTPERRRIAEILEETLPAWKSP